MKKYPLKTYAQRRNFEDFFKGGYTVTMVMLNGQRLVYYSAPGSKKREAIAKTGINMAYCKRLTCRKTTVKSFLAYYETKN